MDNKPLIENIEFKNEVLYNAIKDIADWWAKNVNYLGNKISHYNITAMDLEEGVYDIYDTVMKSYILFPISSHIQNNDNYYAFFQQVRFLSDFIVCLMHDIDKLYGTNYDTIISLFEAYKKFIDTKNEKQQIKKED